MTAATAGGSIIAGEGYEDRGRFDLIQRILDVDLVDGTVSYRLEPNPLRYEWQDRPGERVLYDRLDDVYMTYDVVMDALRQAHELMTSGDAPPTPLGILDHLNSYLARRRPHIAHVLDGGRVDADADPSLEALREAGGRTTEFVVMCVDIVDSTRLTATLDNAMLGRLLDAFQTEIGELVALFYGHVLAPRGDGLVAYFPASTFITRNDLAIDAAFCVRQLVRKALAPELRKKGLPVIEVRIGLDAGEAIVQPLGSAATKRQDDLVGKVIALAAKIEQSAPAGAVLAGETMVRNMHVDWRRQLEVVEPPGDWPFTWPDGSPYKVFGFTRVVKRPVENARKPPPRPGRKGR